MWLVFLGVGCVTLSWFGFLWFSFVWFSDRAHFEVLEPIAFESNMLCHKKHGIQSGRTRRLWLASRMTKSFPR